jgi:hypothetical protein
MTTFVKGFFPVRAHTRRKPLPSADFVATTKALAGFVLSERQQVEDLGDMLIGALLRANLAEPLDGEEFDDLSDERKQQMRETM